MGWKIKKCFQLVVLKAVYKGVSIAVCLFISLFPSKIFSNPFYQNAEETTMQPVVAVLRDTTVIGTVDHPTIDGGIINAAGQTFSSPSKSTLSNDTYHNVPHFSSLANATKEEMSAKPFADEWATSETVRHFLEAAVQQGKLAYVLQEGKALHLPASVAVVPMVESHYQTNAISPKGAGGAWQLMPTTAVDFGLSDKDRFEFKTSTVAALQLLNQLHQQFGNWELAFAAYNAGPSRVMAALQENPHAASVNDLDLPTETKRYVAKIKAINESLIKYSQVWTTQTSHKYDYEKDA